MSSYDISTRINENKIKNNEIMRKSIFTLMGVVMTTVAAVAATFVDNDKQIKYEALPTKARAFITEFFPNEQVAYAIEDKEHAHTEYEVVMANGTKIDFDDKGVWQDVECRGGVVPGAIVPQKIADYIAKKYPESKVVEISKEHNAWEVTLGGGLELKFDHECRFVGIDN